MLEEIIGCRSPVGDGNQLLSLRAALERVRGTGLAMLRGWNVTSQRTPVTIRATPQRAVRPQRFILPIAEASNWVVHQIRIRNGDQLLESISGDAFGTPQGVSFDFPDVQALAPIEIDVEYIGGAPEGAVFRGLFMCVPEEDGSRMVSIPLPIDSGRSILPSIDDGIRVWIQLDEQMFRFEGRANRLDRIVNVTQMPAAAEALGLEANPRMVSLHLIELPFKEDFEIVLFGIDDATSRVVFEIGDMIRAAAYPPRFDAKCDPAGAGFVPEWWDRV